VHHHVGSRRVRYVAGGAARSGPKCSDDIQVLHSGGWKRLQDQAIEKALFNDQLVRVFGCSPDRIIDFYGMVESVGVIFPDCSEGNKHAPVFGDGPRPCVVNHIFN
jgi:acyl-protein synthetase LuxE